MKWAYSVAIVVVLIALGALWLTTVSAGPPRKDGKPIQKTPPKVVASPDKLHCDMVGTLFVQDNDSTDIVVKISSQGLLWDVNTRRLKLSTAEIRKMHGSQVRAVGDLYDLQGTRILDVSLLKAVPGEAGFKLDRTPAYVRGYIVTKLPARIDPKSDIRQREQLIYVPGVDVTLQDPITREAKAKTRTDLSGRFNFPGQPPGTYLLSWRMRGFVPGSRAAPLVVLNKPVYAGENVMPVAEREHHSAVYGKVTDLDGRVPRFLEPLANINAFAKVSSIDEGGGITATAFVNNEGMYILPQVANHQDVAIQTEIENMRETRTVSKEVLQRESRRQVDILVQNHAPRIGPLLTTIAGVRVRSAGVGTEVELSATAQDEDGDAVRYLWLTDTGSTLSAFDKATTAWKAPESGVRTADLIASDGKGGYARATVSLPSQPGVLFSGQVVDGSGAGLADATITINGVSLGKSNPAGFASVIAAEADRFVVNIRKPGFGFVSRIYAEGVTGGRWSMQPASVFTVDPTQPISLTDGRQKVSCFVPFSFRPQRDGFELRRQPRFQNGKGSVTKIGDRPLDLDPALIKVSRSRREGGCGPGISIGIPANALVDAEGNPPAGMVTVALSTVDVLAPDSMPGDYTVREADGSSRYMESWGAGIIEITAGDTQYNLKEGVSAKIRIPISDVQLADARPEPATIPLLTYDEKAGEWRSTGEAKRDGNAYMAEVKHFSAINSDLVKTNQTCLRIHSPQPSATFPLGLPPQYNLEVTIPQGSGAPRVITALIDNSVPYHVIYNLPTNTDVLLVPYSTVDNVPFGTFVVNSGPPQAPGTPSPPPYPYDASPNEVLLYDVGFPAPPNNAFLSGLYSFASTNLSELDPAGTLSQQITAATQDYYAQVDAAGLRDTLDEFKSQNGFGGADEINARYVNAADLGFGRDMHAVKRLASDGNFDYAFYVTNYGAHDTPDAADFQKAVDANPLQAGATVAMEYSRLENSSGGFVSPERAVKFFVYLNNTRQNAANLDGFGARPVPQLCMICHGGEIPTAVSLAVPAFTNPDDVRLGSRFVPFDLASFTIVDGVNPSFNKAAQQDEFRALNQLVRETSPGAPSEELIDLMYPGGAGNQLENVVASGWSADAAHAAGYRNVFAKSCRVCHYARPLETGRDIRLWNSAATVPLIPVIDFRVFNPASPQVMPHALITYNRFWGSRDPAGTSILYPYQPAQLIAWGRTFGPSDFGQLGTAPVPADVPPTANYGPIQQIWNNRCTVCHSSGGIASFLPLTSGVSHGNIVNKPSINVPGLSRDLIEPGSVDLSYLWHKLSGTQASVGGAGGRMPLGGSPLSASEMDLIQQWIINGATSTP